MKDREELQLSKQFHFRTRIFPPTWPYGIDLDANANVASVQKVELKKWRALH